MKTNDKNFVKYKSKTPETPRNIEYFAITRLIPILSFDTNYKPQIAMYQSDSLWLVRNPNLVINVKRDMEWRILDESSMHTIFNDSRLVHKIRIIVGFLFVSLLNMF